MRWLAILMLLLSSPAGSRAQNVAQVSPGQAAPASRSARLEDEARRLIPLHIGEESFTVVLHVKRIALVGEETVAGLHIEDINGRTVYQTEFPYDLDDNHFVESTEVSARELHGPNGSGILLTCTVEPSTPLGGSTYQVFGLFEHRLVPFSKPIGLEGGLIETDPASRELRTLPEPDLQGDTLQFRVWTGNFFVIVPILVDWLQAKTRPAWRCSQMTAGGPEPVCRYRVEARRVPQQQEMTFVRLLPLDDSNTTAEHVVIHRGSKIEILEASGVLRWEEDSNGIGLSTGDDLWLKVRIDGREGWIHSQEDFNAIGLPQAG